MSGRSGSGWQRCCCDSHCTPDFVWWACAEPSCFLPAPGRMTRSELSPSPRAALRPLWHWRRSHRCPECHPEDKMPEGEIRWSGGEARQGRQEKTGKGGRPAEGGAAASSRPRTSQTNSPPAVCVSASRGAPPQPSLSLLRVSHTPPGGRRKVRVTWRVGHSCVLRTGSPKPQRGRG